MRPRLQALLDDYAQDHQHPLNQATHKLGVPLVLFHILAMLEWIDLFVVPGTDVTLTGAHLLLLIVAPWYLSLDLPLTMIVGGLSLVMIGVAPSVPVWGVLAITVVAWALQFVGHYVFEKRSPAFFKNLVQLLVGPLFVAALLTGRWKPRTAAV